MRYASICSGIEAPAAAWQSLGFTPAWFSEIDRHCNAVLAHHHPLVPNVGDLNGLSGRLTNDQKSVDLIVAGTPCQSFSLAGLRGGLDDQRGNLALEFSRVVDACRPRWVVWENVPGVLSSGGGRDFGSIIRALEAIGYGLFWRVLDAQHVRVDSHARAVPQRRKRVFLIGYLGDWRPPAAVLLEREGLRGDPSPRRKAGQVAAGTLAGRASGGGGLGADFECDGGTVAQPLLAKHNLSHRDDIDTLIPVSLAYGGGNTSGPIDVATCVPTRTHIDFDVETFVTHPLPAAHDSSEDGTGRGVPVIPVAFDARQSDVCVYGDRAGPLDTDGHSQAIAFSSKDSGGDASDEVSPTLRACPHDASHANGGGPVAVAVYDNQPPRSVSIRGRGTELDRTENVASAIKGGEGGHSKPHVLVDTCVRRLTPLECERLMGFEDGFTAIDYRGRPMRDGPRYRLLGNSMCVNVLRWLGHRILMVDVIVAARGMADRPPSVTIPSTSTEDFQ